MARISTHYDTLNVSQNAPLSVIKAAYKALSQKYHPDKYPGGPEEALKSIKNINAAYAVLSDPGKRAEHDHWIEKQKRVQAHHEAQRIMQMMTKTYSAPPVTVTVAPSRVTIYKAGFIKFWNSICAGYLKFKPIPLQVLKRTNSVFWLSVIAGFIACAVFSAILFLLPQLKTTSSLSDQEAAAMLKKAEYFVKQAQLEKALPLYSRLASEGNADAQFNLGLLYANGKGVSKDDKQAFDWFDQAAQHGHREAQTKLGYMYATGKGVAQNYHLAVYWCYKAAEQGDVIAQYNLGQMYAKGQGVAKDNNLALSWFNKAAAQGDARAQYSLGEMYANGTGVAKDDLQALEWYRKAAQQGLAEAVATLKQLER